jgi:hypothetical protein
MDLRVAHCGTRCLFKAVASGSNLLERRGPDLQDERRGKALCTITEIQMFTALMGRGDTHGEGAEQSPFACGIQLQRGRGRTQPLLEKAHKRTAHRPLSTGNRLLFRGIAPYRAVADGPLQVLRPWHLAAAD